MLDSVVGQGFIGFLKIAFFVLEAVYFIYTIITIFQVKLMNQSFRTPVAILFTFFAFVQFLVMLGLLVLSFFVLL